MKCKRPHNPINSMRTIQAVAPDSNVVFAAAEGESAQRRINMVAYTGGPMNVGFSAPVYIDLAGLVVSAKNTPFLIDHRCDAGGVVGQADDVRIEGGQVLASGPVLGSSEDVANVVALADAGFAWQASVGVEILARRYVPSGETIQINGRVVQGEAIIVKRGRLREISIVSVGADDKTSTVVAADGGQKGLMMDENFRKWLEDQGLVPEELDDAKIAESQKQYEDEKAAPPAEDAPPVEASAAILAARREAATELRRHDDIRKICGAAHTEIAAKAIENGWSRDRAELEVLRASRPKAPSVRTGVQDVSGKALQCAALMQSELPGSRVEALYDERTLDAADKFRRSGIRGLIEAACSVDGIARPAISAGAQEWVRAAFSSSTMTSVLSTSANKLMIEMFNTAAGAALTLFKRVTARNFLTHTGYRMTGGIMTQVGEGGELKHGTLADNSKTFTVNTYGELLGITRQMMVNDDLGMFLALPARLGRDAAETIEDVAWTLVKANTSSFFGAGHSNVITGATTALGTTGLDLAVKALSEQTADGRPIRVRGKYLVVPPALEGEALRLFTASNVIATGVGATTAKKIDAAANIYSGVFEPVVVPDLSATVDSSAGSDAMWYLWADPAGSVAPFALAFLNGVDKPVIEEADPDPKFLGTTWRGYIDFGVAQWDTEGAIRSAGA